DLLTTRNPAATYALYVALFCVLIFVALRFGVVVTVSAVFFLNTLNAVSLGTDWTTWYTAPGLATLALILAMVGFAFIRSLGSRPRASPPQSITRRNDRTRATLVLRAAEPKLISGSNDSGMMHLADLSCPAMWQSMKPLPPNPAVRRGAGAHIHNSPRRRLL